MIQRAKALEDRPVLPGINPYGASLEEGENHPSVHRAAAWIEALPEAVLLGLRVVIAAEVRKGDREATLCLSTLERYLDGTSVLDRYLIGTVLYMRDIAERAA